MVVTQKVLPGQIAFTKLTYNPKAKRSDSCEYAKTSFIENDDLKLEYQGLIRDHVIYFDLTDKLTKETKPLGFSMRYWTGANAYNESAETDFDKLYY